MWSVNNDNSQHAASICGSRRTLATMHMFLNQESTSGMRLSEKLRIQMRLENDSILAVVLFLSEFLQGQLEKIRQPNLMMKPLYTGIGALRDQV